MEGGDFDGCPCLDEGEEPRFSRPGEKRESTMDEPDLPPAPSYTFVLKLTDQPGGMEVVAATFAHRGVSISSSLGNDGGLDPQGRATILVTFSATPAKKEIIRRALGRLSRVRSLVEYPMDAPQLRKTAVFRLAGVEPYASSLPARVLEPLAGAVAGGGCTYLLVDTAATVDAIIEEVRRSGRLLDISATVLAL